MFSTGTYTRQCHIYTYMTLLIHINKIWMYKPAQHTHNTSVDYVLIFHINRIWKGLLAYVTYRWSRRHHDSTGWHWVQLCGIPELMRSMWSPPPCTLSPSTTTVVNFPQLHSIRRRCVDTSRNRELGLYPLIEQLLLEVIATYEANTTVPQKFSVHLPFVILETNWSGPNFMTDFCLALMKVNVRFFHCIFNIYIVQYVRTSVNTPCIYTPDSIHSSWVTLHEFSALQFCSTLQLLLDGCHSQICMHFAPIRTHKVVWLYMAECHVVFIIIVVCAVPGFIHIPKKISPIGELPLALLARH